MRLLVAVTTCVKDIQKGCNQAIRDTWAKDFSGVDVRFFRGQSDLRDSFGSSDEIVLNCPDDYDGLPFKTRRLAEFVVQNGYDFLYKADTDTFLKPDRLLSCGFEQYDYAGKFVPPNFTVGRAMQDLKDERGIRHSISYPWASGGVGYFLSRRACELVARTEPTHWAEDFWVGQLLSQNQREYRLCDLPNFEGTVSWHHCSTGQKREFNPTWMYDAYRKGQP